MKTNNNSFSLRRVGLLMRRDIVENKKTFLFFTLLLSVIFLFIMFVSAWATPAGEEAYLTLSLSTLNGYTKVFSFYSIFVWSGIMANIQTKETRTNFLMLPASNIEKFLGRLIYVTLLVFVPFIAAILLADVLQMLIFPLFAGEGDTVRFLLLGFWEVKAKAGFTIQEFMSQNADYAPYLYALPFISCISTIWEASVYVLGGCYWRNHPFMKTVATMLSITIVVTIVLIFSFFQIVNEIGASVESVEMWIDKYLWGLSPESLIFICIGVCFIWALLNFYLAYRLFCRSQVVEPKRFRR